MEILQPYINDVLNNPKDHGRAEILAVERYLRDLEREDLYFDEEIVNKRLKAAKILRHTKDRFDKIPFGLQPFQIFIIANLFGFYHKDTGRRRFKRFYFDISRKNGKTEFAVLLCVLIWYFEDVAGSELYFAATKKEQAKIGFDMFKRMLTHLRGDSQIAQGEIRILAHSIINEINGSTSLAVSSDANTLDGLNPLVYLIDEYHAHPTSSVLKVMQSGSVSRENPMGIITTTAGFDKQKPCYKFRNMSMSVLNQDLDDDALFAMIFAMDEGDDWEDTSNWKKCNPNLGVTMTIDTLVGEYASAKNEGAVEINNFKTKNLNVWTSSAISFITDKQWMMNASDPVINDEMKCWGGLDISSNRDLTAYVLLFENGSILPFFWCPQTKIEERGKGDGVDYLQWAKDDFIEVIRGNSIDHRIIKQRILDLNAEYNVQANIYDPWHGRQIAQELIEQGVSMIEMAQNYKYETEPLKNLEANALKCEYKHGGHPILRWNAENSQLKVGNNEGRMLQKEETKTEGAKIDGMVSLMMAEYGRTLKIQDKRYKGLGVSKL